MRAERVDIGERRILDAGDRSAVMQRLANIGPAAAHLLEPWPHDQAKRIGARLDRAIATRDRAGLAKNRLHFFARR